MTVLDNSDLNSEEYFDDDDDEGEYIIEPIPDVLHGNRVFIAIADDGCGMSEEELEMGMGLRNKRTPDIFELHQLLVVGVVHPAARPRFELHQLGSTGTFASFARRSQAK